MSSKPLFAPLLLHETLRTASEVCGLPSETGPCKAHMIRYFYNVESAACEQFVYGGCLGNANNFKSREECEKSCSKSACVCSLGTRRLAFRASRLVPRLMRVCV